MQEATGGVEHRGRTRPTPGRAPPESPSGCESPASSGPQLRAHHRCSRQNVTAAQARRAFLSNARSRQHLLRDPLHHPRQADMTQGDVVVRHFVDPHRSRVWRLFRATLLSHVLATCPGPIRPSSISTLSYRTDIALVHSGAQCGVSTWS